MKRFGNALSRLARQQNTHFAGTEIKEALQENMEITRKGLKGFIKEPIKGLWKDATIGSKNRPSQMKGMVFPHLRRALQKHSLRTAKQGIEATKRSPGKAIYKGVTIGLPQAIPIPGTGVAAIGVSSVVEGTSRKLWKLARGAK